ncbi:exosortase V [Phenylobacterium sp.]|uniref:exosortase V n=1 Tax=Phenylobacterium sp. TaxID=1871053 RepID=UPI002B593616|nr:exosortase V [Phenylobacterium sp.]HLZ75495.1 exosortase V [Phenylobacterium sp.]
MKHWPLVLALAALGIPTLITLGQQVWSTEIGAHGPIVLATGLWLAWRQSDQLKKDAQPGASWLTALGLAFSLALYVFGRAYEFMVLEVAGLYGVCLSFLHAYVGVRAMLRNWFPILYLGFVIPPPGWAIDSLTAPLKEFVSYAATTILQAAGLPIIREGVTLMVAQYQLLVEDACSGMNSLIGLIAISLFYIYLARNASWRYSIFLVSLVIPIAILANIIRIIILVLLTYFLGDGVAQSFLHVTAGLFLFAIALLLVFAVDSLVSRFLHARRKAAA